jgi:D-alanine-D-alanine ligase
MMKVAILYGEVSPDAGIDEQDVLVQRDKVADELVRLGYEPVAVPMSLNLKKAASALKRIQPAFVFNLVESLDGNGQFIHVAPTLLEYLKLPYTGSRKDAVYLTSNKLLAKQTLKAAGIHTPHWMTLQEVSNGHVLSAGSYIIKAVWEHASIGIDGDSVVQDKQRMREILQARRRKFGGEWYAERYIPGREFNVSLLAGKDGEPEVFPPAEIKFINYPPGKPKIVDYSAKWEEDSFEFKHTPRIFDFGKEDAPLLVQLEEISRQCWNLFGLRGYARIDFRVDERKQPWVLEVNINPCLSPDGGYTAAAERVGMDFTQVVERLIEDAVDTSPEVNFRGIQNLEGLAGC